MFFMIKSLLAFKLRCPHCDIGPLTRRFYGAVRECPNCHYIYQKDEGDFWGGMVFSYVFAGVAGMTTGLLLTVAGWLSTADRVYLSAGVGVGSV